MVGPGDLGSFPDLAAAWLSGLFDAALRGTLLLLLATAAARLMRDAPAAARHAVWASALVGLLLTPLLQPLVPAVEAPFVPDVQLPVGAERPASTATAEATAPEPTAFALPLAPGDVASAPGISEPLRVGPPPAPPADGTLERTVDRLSAWGPAGILGAVWLAGFLAVLGTLVLGKVRIWWLARGATRVRDRAWLELRDELAGRLGVSRPIRVLRSPRPLVPMTWGIVRPRILLPAAADRWPEACKRNVLLHELAHVKRMDLAVRHLARLVCALYWFHPLVWMAGRRLRLEQEEACDDHVLRGGALASDYARHLVGLVRALKSVRSTARMGSTGGGRSDFTRRLRALLSPSRGRQALSGRWLGLTLGVAGAVIVALAALAPATPERSATGGGAPAGSPGLTALEGNGGSGFDVELPSVRVEPEGEGGRLGAGEEAPEARAAAAAEVPPRRPESAPTESADAGPEAGAEPPESGPVLAVSERRGPKASSEVASSPRAARESARAGSAESGTGPSAEEADGREGGAGAKTWAWTVGTPATVTSSAFGALSPDVWALLNGKSVPGVPRAERRAAEDSVPSMAKPAVETSDLVARLNATPDSSRRADLLRRAARAGEAGWMTVLMEVSVRAARHGDRVEAVRTLAREAAREKGGRYLYQVARANPWPSVRSEAIHQLRQHRPDRAVPWLVHLAYHDRERAVQRRAVGALARLGGRGVDSGLMQIARSHPDAEVRIAAIYWLVKTGSGDALAKYVQAA